MAVPTTSMPDQGTSPTNIAFSSNNPFRNRLSALSTSPTSADGTKQNFPFPSMSKNPFLDPTDGRVTNNTATATTNGNSVALADDIFKDLSLLDKPAANRVPPPSYGQSSKSGALPSEVRPVGSNERRERPQRGPPRGPDSAQKRPDHRRRASESSIMDDKQFRSERDRRDRGGERAPRTESEERRRRERRKEREERYKREGRSKSSRSKPQRNLDLIDKLDVTGIYGEGLFHHDGPFDACNPHRNARKNRRAPMEAFPEGSANMALGGAGPNRSRLDLDKFHGRGEEGFQDFSTTRRADTSLVAPQFTHPHDKVEQVHGEESYGLGTSTFLDGAPASKSALQRHESGEQTLTFQDPSMGSGLQRKKSLAQRLRGMSASQRRAGPGEIRSPDARYRDTDGTGDSPPRIRGAVSAGGPSRAKYTKENEINPFDDEYDDAFEKKGAQIRIAEQERPNIGRARAPSSPKGAALTRSVTADGDVRSPGVEDEKPSFLNRMKSLKGGRRARPERKDSQS